MLSNADVDGALLRLVVSKREAWRATRADLLFKLLDVRPGGTILDLGGQDGSFMLHVRERVDARVTIADLDTEGLDIADSRGFATCLLTEGEPLPFADGAFDVVFCNSVIEHVTFPKDECLNRKIPQREWVTGSLRNQAAFAAEIRRVGRSYFVQTPHKAFPIEAHTWLPVIGWLPHQLTVSIVKVSDRYWIKHCGCVDWNLLGTAAMRRFFPDASIHVERELGIPKSLIAYRR